MAQISYNFKSSAQNELFVEDPGNCAIKATDSCCNEHWFLSTSTRGFCSICIWGPVTSADSLNEFPCPYSLFVKRIKYNYHSCISEIQKFLSYRRPSISGTVIIETAENTTKQKALNSLLSSTKELIAVYELEGEK